MITVDAQWLALQLSERSARGLGAGLRALIIGGEIPVGARLPPLRDLAHVLRVSPATLSQAFALLRHQHMIDGRGRNGTVVLAQSPLAGPTRLGQIADFGHGVRDLSMAVPDPALLPRLDRALAHAAGAPGLNSYVRERIQPALRAAAERIWPYPAPTFLATNGGYNAFYALVHSLLTPGDLVAIEEPSALRLLDILEDFGARLLPVACDAQGMKPEALAEALAQKPAMIVYQPRCHSATGHAIGAERMAELGDLLAGAETLIVEDDGVGLASPLPSRSLGGRFPDRVLHILSVSKSLGPDLRLAILSGPGALIRRIQSYRSFSAGWTSRLLQEATAWLLSDPESMESVAHAHRQYAARRDALRAALAQCGVETPEGFGLSLWVPVEQESYALLTLAARGYSVMPGSKCFLRGEGFIRIATASMADGHEALAEAVALGAKGGQ